MLVKVKKLADVEEEVDNAHYYDIHGFLGDYTHEETTPGWASE